MKKSVKLLSALLAALLTVSAMPVSAFAAESADSQIETRAIAEDLTWEITEDGVLKINGTGDCFCIGNSIHNGSCFLLEGGGGIFCLLTAGKYAQQHACGDQQTVPVDRETEEIECDSIDSKHFFFFLRLILL